MAAEKHITELINTALSALPWPCHLQNHISTGDEDIYLVWYMTGQTARVTASNKPRRQVQQAQVSIYSAWTPVTEIGTTVKALRNAGLRVTSFGATGYDSATGMYNSPIMVEMAVRAEQMI